MSATTPDSARWWQGSDEHGYQDKATGDWGKKNPETGNIEYDPDDERNPGTGPA